MTLSERTHHVWANGPQLETYDLMCSVCLSYQEDNMVLDRAIHERNEWKGKLITESHSVLLVGAGCFMMEHHWVVCKGEDASDEGCCSVTNQSQTRIPGEFAAVMCRYWGLPERVQQEAEAAWRIA